MYKNTMYKNAVTTIFFSLVLFYIPYSFAQKARIGLMVKGDTDRSLTMEKAINFAVSEANKSGMFFDGTKIVLESEHNYCNDDEKGVEAALNLINTKKIDVLIGGTCSGVAIELLEKVSMKKNIITVSPSATSPFLSDIHDNDLFFRTVPSDHRQSIILAEEILHRGISNLSIAYINSAYGFSLAQVVANSFLQRGGKIIHMQEIPKFANDYSTQAKVFAAKGGQAMLISGRFESGGGDFLKAMLKRRTFRYFIFPDGMISNDLEKISAKLNGSFGIIPSINNSFMKQFKEASNVDIKATDVFTAAAYDAAALVILAMQAAKSTKTEDFGPEILRVANPPGVKIKFGEIGKALKILKEGGEVDLVGASNLKLIPPGESTGNYTIVKMHDGKIIESRKR